MPVKTITFKIYSLPICGSKMEVMYDPKNKEFVDYTRSDQIVLTPLTEKMESILNTNNRSSCMYGDNAPEKELPLLMCVPDFKKLYDSIIKGAKPKFKKGQTVWKFNDKNIPKFYTAQEHIGWKAFKGCNIKTFKSEEGLSAIWDFVCTETGHVTTRIEETFKPVSEFEIWEEGKKAALTMRKLLKTEKLHGGSVSFAGNVYKF